MAGKHRTHPDTRVQLLDACHYPQLPSTPSAARDHAVKVAGHLTDVDALKLCVSELVTNSVIHAHPGPITVVLWHENAKGFLRIEVIDNGAPTDPRAIYDLEAINCRGLFLVEQTAITWDYYRDQAGLTTWCTLAALQNEPKAGSTSLPVTRSRAAM